MKKISKQSDNKSGWFILYETLEEIADRAADIDPVESPSLETVDAVVFAMSQLGYIELVE